MSDTANLTKKEQQEIRGAEARISRVAKLQKELEEARELASKGTVKKIEDINAQTSKLDERIGKVDEQIAATQERRAGIVARKDELIKAKYILAEEITEFLSHDDRIRLHLDAPETVADNTPLTGDQAAAIADSAEQAEAAENAAGESETPAEADAKDEPVADDVTAPVADAPAKAEPEAENPAEPVKAKTTRTRTVKAK